MAGNRQRRGPDARTQGPIRFGEWVVGRNAVEDGRGRLFCFAMQSALQRAAENSWQLTLRRRVVCCHHAIEEAVMVAEVRVCAKWKLSKAAHSPRSKVNGYREYQSRERLLELSAWIGGVGKARSGIAQVL